MGLSSSNFQGRTKIISSVLFLKNGVLTKFKRAEPAGLVNLVNVWSAV